MWRVSRTIIRKAVNSGLPSEEEHSSGVGSKLARLSTRTTNRVEASCCQASVLPHPPRSLPCPRLSSLRRRVGITSFKNVLSLESAQEETDTYWAYINGLDSSLKCIPNVQFEQRISNLSAVRSAWLAMV